MGLRLGFRLRLSLVGVEVGVEVEVKVRAQNYFFGVDGWVVGLAAGEMGNKTNLPT